MVGPAIDPVRVGAARRAKHGTGAPAGEARSFKASNPQRLTAPMTLPAARRLGATELAHRLAQHTEAVCRLYLSNGHRCGSYWRVGDVANTPGRSLYVCLSGPRSGRWSDAATGEHGDLLDLIAVARRLPSLRHALTEARQFLSLPAELPHPPPEPVPSDKTCAARRLFGMGRPIAGTLAETYLLHRGIAQLDRCPSLRFHPHCYYREGTSQEKRQALLAAITDLAGRITGVQRTWLEPTGRGKAAVATPRRTLGRQLGNAVRFGSVDEVMLAGEGIETVLSLKTVLPGLPMLAALSASNLGGLLLPPELKRLYVARDRDPAGEAAFQRLARRAAGLGLMVRPLDPIAGDFNDDLIGSGAKALRAALERQLAAEDAGACSRVPIVRGGVE
jgi:Toprim domain